MKKRQRISKKRTITKKDRKQPQDDDNEAVQLGLVMTEYDQRILHCREIVSSYLKIIFLIFSFLLVKTHVFDEIHGGHLLHFPILVVVGLCLKFHSVNNVTTRLTPLIIAVLSYFGHTRFLFARKFEELILNNDTDQLINIDALVSHVVICGAFFLNHVYLDTFLTVTRMDSFIMNTITWGLFLIEGFTNAQFSIKTKLTMLILVLFAIKFSVDGMRIKDEIFKLYTQQQKACVQWVRVFKYLPIGMLVSKDDVIVQSNRLMMDIATNEREVIHTTLQSLLQTGVGGEQKSLPKKEIFPSKDSILRKLFNLGEKERDANENLKYLQTLLDRIEEEVRIQLVQEKEELDSSSGCSDQEILANQITLGEITYTYVLHHIPVLNTKLKVMLLSDMTHQEKLYKSTLEQKYKNIFLSSISHQLRTPLNSMILNNAILKQLCKDNLKVLPILEQDKLTHSLLEYQIADMFEFSKLETGDFTVRTTDFKIRDLMTEMREIFEPMANKKKVDYYISTSTTVPHQIKSDKIKLGQVLVNILMNAVKFTPDGNIQVHTSLVTNGGSPSLKISVKDTGKGIENIKQMKKMFGNLSVLNKVNQNGMGFGLDISSRLIQKLGGSLDIANNENPHNNPKLRGVTVTIMFPIDIVHLNSQEIHSPHDTGAECTPVNKEILLTDNVEAFFGEEEEGCFFPQNILDCGFTSQPFNKPLFSPYKVPLNILPGQQQVSILQIKQSNTAALAKIPSLLEQEEEEEKAERVVKADAPKNRLQFKQSGSIAKFHDDFQTHLQQPNSSRDKKTCCNQILVIDDNPFNVESLRLILEHCYNIQCDVAFSGVEGLKMVQERVMKWHKNECKETYSLILTDINMPVLDGIQMTVQIRSYLLDKNQPVDQYCYIWAVTAMNEEEILSQAVKTGLDGVCVKPLTHSKLENILIKCKIV